MKIPGFVVSAIVHREFGSPTSSWHQNVRKFKFYRGVLLPKPTSENRLTGYGADLQNPSDGFQKFSKFIMAKKPGREWDSKFVVIHSYS